MTKKSNKNYSGLTYWQSLLKVALALLFGWGMLAQWLDEVKPVFKRFVRAAWMLFKYVLGLVLILLAPALVALSPVIAAMALNSDRKRERAKLRREQEYLKMHSANKESVQ